MTEADFLEAQGHRRPGRAIFTLDLRMILMVQQPLLPGVKLQWLRMPLDRTRQESQGSCIINVTEESLT